MQPDDFADNVASFVNASSPIFNFNVSTFSATLNLGNPVAGSYFMLGPDANATISNSTSAAAANSTAATIKPTAQQTSGAGFSRELSAACASAAMALLGIVLI